MTASGLEKTAALSEDQQLVAAVLRKDRKATARLVELHADAVYSYIRHRLIPRADLVDDLVQDVFLAVWERLNDFRGESSLRSWILGVARHKVEDHYRARLREAADLPEGEVEPEYDDLLDRERLQEKTRRVLEALPEPYSLALLWRYWEKRSARDIAAQTGKTEKAVERLLARAREQFRRRWNNE